MEKFDYYGRIMWNIKCVDFSFPDFSLRASGTADFSVKYCFFQCVLGALILYHDFRE